MSFVYSFDNWSYQTRVYVALLITFVGGYILGLITPLIIRENTKQDEIKTSFEKK